MRLAQQGAPIYTGDGHISACQGDPAMPHSTFVEIPEEKQAQMLAALRRARYGYLLARHILWLCAVGRHPTEIAAVLFCSRSMSIVPCAPIRRALSAGSTTIRAGSCRQGVRPCWSRRCDGRCWPCSKLPHGLWVVPHALELCHAGPDAAVQTGLAARRRRCAAGSMSATGCGNAPNGSQRR